MSVTIPTIETIPSNVTLRDCLLRDLNAGSRIRPSKWGKEHGFKWQAVSVELTKMAKEGLCECYAGDYFIRK